MLCEMKQKKKEKLNMKKERKPLSTKKPPVPSKDHEIITKWINTKVMPEMQPLVKEIDNFISENVPNLQYAIKWGYAFYGTENLGWLFQVSPFAVSVNIVFFGGAHFENQPPLGNDESSRYLKLNSIDEIRTPEVLSLIEQAKLINGWT